MSENNKVKRRSGRYPWGADEDQVPTCMFCGKELTPGKDTPPGLCGSCFKAWTEGQTSGYKAGLEQFKEVIDQMLSRI